MGKRLIISVLWFYAVWTVLSPAAYLVGVPLWLGAIPSVAVAFLVGGGAQKLKGGPRKAGRLAAGKVVRSAESL